MALCDVNDVETHTPSDRIHCWNSWLPAISGLEGILAKIEQKSRVRKCSQFSQSTHTDGNLIHLIGRVAKDPQTAPSVLARGNIRDGGGSIWAVILFRILRATSIQRAHYAARIRHLPTLLPSSAVTKTGGGLVETQFEPSSGPSARSGGRRCRSRLSNWTTSGT